MSLLFEFFFSRLRILSLEKRKRERKVIDYHTVYTNRREIEARKSLAQFQYHPLQDYPHSGWRDGLNVRNLKILLPRPPPLRVFPKPVAKSCQQYRRLSRDTTRGYRSPNNLFFHDSQRGKHSVPQSAPARIALDSFHPLSLSLSLSISHLARSSSAMTELPRESVQGKIGADFRRRANGLNGRDTRKLDLSRSSGAAMQLPGGST